MAVLSASVLFYAVLLGIITLVWITDVIRRRRNPQPVDIYENVVVTPLESAPDYVELYVEKYNDDLDSLQTLLKRKESTPDQAQQRLAEFREWFFTGVPEKYHAAVRGRIDV